MMEPFLFYIVIYSRNFVESDKFYSKIGFNIQKHKHGDGDQHLVCKNGDVLLEIYPLEKKRRFYPGKTQILKSLVKMLLTLLSVVW